MWWFIFVGALIGLVVSGTLSIVGNLTPIGWLASSGFDGLMLMLWPSSIIMMALADYEFPDSRYIAVLAIAILINVFVYAIGGLVMWLCLKIRIGTECKNRNKDGI